MAHQIPDRAAINEAAEAAAAQVEPPVAPAAEITLAYHAEGPAVTQLVDLLALLGFATNDVIAGKSTTLDESVLVDLRAAKEALGIEADSRSNPLAPTDIPIGIVGELVDGATWDALYAAAAEKVQPAADGAAAAAADVSLPAGENGAEAS